VVEAVSLVGEVAVVTAADVEASADVVVHLAVADVGDLVIVVVSVLRGSSLCSC
jgi:hypothetical protein